NVGSIVFRPSRWRLSTAHLWWRRFQRSIVQFEEWLTGTRVERQQGGGQSYAVSERVLSCADDSDLVSPADNVDRRYLPAGCHRENTSVHGFRVPADTCTLYQMIEHCLVETGTLAELAK